MQVSCFVFVTISLISGLQIYQCLDIFTCSKKDEQTNISLSCQRRNEVIQTYLVYARTVNNSVKCDGQVPDIHDYECANYNSKLLHLLRSSCNMKNECQVAIEHETIKPCARMDDNVIVHIHVMYQCRSGSNALTGNEMTKVEIMGKSNINYTGAQATLVSSNYPKSTDFRPSTCKIILKEGLKLRIDIFEFSYEESDNHPHNYGVVPYIMKIDNSSNYISADHSAPTTAVKEILESNTTVEHIIQFEKSSKENTVVRIWMVLSGLQVKDNTYSNISLECFVINADDKNKDDVATTKEVKLSTIDDRTHYSDVSDEQNHAGLNMNNESEISNHNIVTSVYSSILTKIITTILYTSTSKPVMQSVSSKNAETVQTTIAYPVTSIPKINTEESLKIMTKNVIEDTTNNKLITSINPKPVLTTIIIKDNDTQENNKSTMTISSILSQAIESSLQPIKTQQTFVPELKSTLSTILNNQVGTEKTTSPPQTTTEKSIPTVKTSKAVMTKKEESNTIVNVETTTQAKPSTTIKENIIVNVKKSSTISFTPTKVADLMVHTSESQSKGVQITAGVLVACIVVIGLVVCIAYLRNVLKNPDSFRFGKLKEDQMVLHFKNSTDVHDDEDIVEVTDA